MENKSKAIYNEVKKALIGKDEVVKQCIIALLAGGHILIEDTPGVGKTTLAKAIAKATGLKTKRVQFTPDTLPSDITGFTMWDAERGEFRFHEGAVMTNLLLADEINRTSPRTQSALLQAMEEGSVSEEGETFQLEQPFIVIATQNPLGSAGTMELPHSQLDRFMMRLSIGGLKEEELSDLIFHRADSGKPQINTVCDKDDVLKMREEVNEVFLSKAIADWVAKLINQVNKNSLVMQGVTTRAALSLSSVAKASAYFYERDFVLPTDVSEAFVNCISHRIVLTSKALLDGVDPKDLCEDALKCCPPPHTKGSLK